MKKMIKKTVYGILCAFLACTIFAGCNQEGTENAKGVLLDEKWTSYQGKGALSLAVAAGNHGESAPRLVKNQIEGEWMIHTHMTYLSADKEGDNHAGLTLYKDAENYLIWGPRNNGALVLSGKIGGKDTGEIACCEEQYYHLRIWKNTTDAECVRYYVYGAKDAYYSWSYVGYFDDVENVFGDAKVGVIGLDYAENSTEGFCVQFEFVNDYVMYMYKDNFNDPESVIDGRWVKGAEKASVKNNKVTLSSQNGQTSMLLRNPLSYAWTIEAEMTTGLGNSDVYTGVCANGGEGILSVGVVGQSARARINDEVIGSIGGNFKFVKIIQNQEGGYSLRASADGKSWETVADYKGDLGDKIQYGLVAEGGDASFEWFCERPTPDGIIKDVESFEKVAQITGEAGTNQTETKYGIGSTDLGSMFELNGAVYMVFGDTFEYSNQKGNYYKNAIAKITDLKNFRTGLNFEWMKLNASNGGLVNSRDSRDPTSMIGTSGIGIVQNGVPTLYMHLMEIRQWTSHGTHWTVNGSGWASSTDDGDTWTLHDRIFEGDTNFAQIACYQEGDYVYILGAAAGGEGSVKLCRVPAAQLVEGDAYEFFVGTDTDGQPQWSSKEEDAVVVIDSVNKEFGVVYNEGLGCFIMTTLDNVNQQMVMRDAKNIWGPWSKPVLLFDESYVEHEDVGQRFFYGSFMNRNFMEDNGRTVYMTLNKWVPYNIQWMRVTFEVEED